MASPRLELETFSVLDWRDNQLHHDTIGSLPRRSDDHRVKPELPRACGKARGNLPGIGCDESLQVGWLPTECFFTHRILDFFFEPSLTAAGGWGERSRAALPLEGRLWVLVRSAYFGSFIFCLIREYYVVCTKLICLWCDMLCMIWYVECTFDLCYVTIIIYDMIDMCMIRIINCKDMISYDMVYVRKNPTVLDPNQINQNASLELSKIYYLTSFEQVIFMVKNAST